MPTLSHLSNKPLCIRHKAGSKIFWYRMWRPKYVPKYARKNGSQGKGGHTSTTSQAGSQSAGVILTQNN